jgi:hypothetical protein
MLLVTGPTGNVDDELVGALGARHGRAWRDLVSQHAPLKYWDR